MPSLFEKWYPVTSDFGLIQMPMNRLLASLQAWHTPLGIEYSRTEITSSLEAAFKSLLPLSHSKMRRLFVPTKSGWVACFQNGVDGSDPSPAMSYLATKMKVMAMRVCATPSTEKYPAVIWEVYAPVSSGGEPPLGYRRSIAAMNDGGHWVFEESGERFPFESQEHYSKTKKRERFTKEMLVSYLKNFSIELGSDEFFEISAAQPAVCLQQVTNGWTAPEFTLDEVTAGIPWQKKT